MGHNRDDGFKNPRSSASIPVKYIFTILPLHRVRGLFFVKMPGSLADFSLIRLTLSNRGISNKKSRTNCYFVSLLPPSLPIASE
jgi:hypothetical protein